MERVVMLKFNQTGCKIPYGYVIQVPTHGTVPTNTDIKKVLAAQGLDTNKDNVAYWDVM